MTLLADKILEFYSTLDIPVVLPGDIRVMNPYRYQDVQAVVDRFYRKFYSDDHSRTLILGINPGRFGGGITGIPFTDPIRLEDDCGIANSFPKKPELSSVFIYEVIRTFGGAARFYSRFFISAVSPLGFLKDGKNYNYYDDHALLMALQPFIEETLRKQFMLITERQRCYCLGEGKNFEFLDRLNKSLSLTGEIIPLPHPRWVMQYKRKKMKDYIDLYIRTLVNN